jgi:hypothetical protein
MTESACTFVGNRDQALVTYLYGDDPRDGSERAFEAHLSTCAMCRDEIEALGGIRAQLSCWAPPEPQLSPVQPSASRQLPVIAPATTAVSTISTRNSWWREIPAWAQVAAALLFLGVSAGLANLDVRYDRQGLTVRTGWSPSRDARSVAPASGAGLTPTPVKAADSAPWKSDLASLEQQLKAEMHASRPAAAPGDADLIRRVRALVDESEKRQQRELALRVAEVLRDVNMQRQSDLAKVNRALGAVENNLGVEVLKTRQQVNLMYRASQVR